MSIGLYVNQVVSIGYQDRCRQFVVSVVDSATGSATTARRLASLATAASHFLVSTLV